MPSNSAFDTRAFDDLNFPYNKVVHDLSDMPRLRSGHNSYVTYGGALQKRPGTLGVTNSSLSGRIERQWVYRTMETPQKVFHLASVRNMATNKYAMYYKRMDLTTSLWTSMGSYRQLNASDYPHECSLARGLAYIKGTPAIGTGELLGSVIFDGSGATPSTKPWGLLGPTTAARISAVVGQLNGTINASTTTITLDSIASFPGGYPFVIQVEYEQMNVTGSPGANQFTVTRGYNGTTAATHDTDTLVLYRSGWAAANHRVDVSQGWFYTYAWKTITDQVSNRAPVEENPDIAPSNTGPFADLCPKITVQGTADTTNVPTICIYRTTDGGGTFFKLDEIPNTGAGDITYEDKHFPSDPSGTTEQDPIPDAFLDTAEIAPSLTSNSPPPSTITPEVVGVDAIKRSSPIAYYQGRHWYWIDNIIVYSAQEELNEGIPEESFPSGLFGNFFRAQEPGISIVATSEAVFAFTDSTTYVITGSTKETFNIRPLYENIGMAPSHPQGVIRFGGSVAFLSNDYRVCLIRDINSDQPQSISDPLGDDLPTQAVVSSCEFNLEYWADNEKEWIVVLGAILDDTAESKAWVYDLRKSKVLQMDFWNTPWEIRASSLVSGRNSETSSRRYLIFSMYDDADASLTSALAYLDADLETGTDYFIDGAENIDWEVVTGLLTIPAGNHVNALRSPALDPSLYAIQFDRILYPGDKEPICNLYQDDLWSTPISLNVEYDPSRRPISTAYATRLLKYNRVGHRFAVGMRRTPTPDLISIENLLFIFEPEAGSGP